MDLNELKKTWDKLASVKDLDENQIRGMLGKRTKNVMERIDRNIKIGFIFLFTLILVFSLDDFWLSPMLLKGFAENLTIPCWIVILDLFCNLLIISTFIPFVVKYYRIRKTCDVACNLKDALLKIINTLYFYQRLFYFALITLLFAIGSGFVMGMYEGFRYGTREQGIILSEIEPGKLFFAVFIGLLILIISVGAIFLFLRWGFRRLYGNYIHQLKATLKELEEIDE